jgi:hypothetical protein
MLSWLPRNAICWPEQMQEVSVTSRDRVSMQGMIQPEWTCSELSAPNRRCMRSYNIASQRLRSTGLPITLCGAG